MKKILEIGVCEIIKKHNKDIVPMHDFEIHDLEQNKTEPDIVKVFRHGVSEKNFHSLEKKISDYKAKLSNEKAKDENLAKLRKQLPKIRECKTDPAKKKARAMISLHKNKRKNIKTKIEDLKTKITQIQQTYDAAKQIIEPKLYVEIKNIDDGDAWIGPKLSEVESIIGRTGLTKKSIYYVYCSIIDAKGKKRGSDLLGVFLKQGLSGKTMKKFHDVSDLSVEIKNVMTVDDITEKYGTEFPKGTIIPNPKIITVASDSTRKSILKKIEEGKLKERTLPDNKLPRETSAVLREKQSDGKYTSTGWCEYPSALGDFTFTGKVKTYPEVLGTVRHLWIKCITGVTILNIVQGKIGPFKKDQLLDYQVKQKGRITSKNVNDVWISRTNAEIMKNFPPERIAEISDRI